MSINSEMKYIKTDICEINKFDSNDYSSISLFGFTTMRPDLVHIFD